jgi:hypothetical protein
MTPRQVYRAFRAFERRTERVRAMQEADTRRAAWIVATIRNALGDRVTVDELVGKPGAAPAPRMDRAGFDRLKAEMLKATG